MVAKESLELLKSLRNLVITRFCKEEGIEGNLSKISQISSVFDKIALHIETTPDSNFTIQTEDGILSVNVSNFPDDLKDDTIRCDTYIITLSPSCLTYEICSVKFTRPPMKIVTIPFEKRKK